ncbi:MAG: hypothetical protein V2J62_08895 [candidate division KSB1 bacterium]|jgi:hypothetical protein|nr:hypothetical protein [candidate division KSB1 bacterium]
MGKLASGLSKIHVGIFVLLISITLVVWIGCQRPVNSPDEATITMAQQTLNKANPRIKAVMAIQERHTQELMLNPNVVGTATGLDGNGDPAVLVFLKEEPKPESLKKSNPIPDMLDGVPVVVEVTGIIRPMRPAKPVPVDHQAMQTPPIQLGTSGGWRDDLANGYCCAGTLGSLVQIGGTKYILSNYHVLEADILSGGNNRIAQEGDPVVQPGLIDVGCVADNTQDVATLSGIKSLPNSNVDAAVAAIIPGMVREDGSILEIGTISSQTVAAYIGQEVKKSGRTTALTRSSVTGLNGTINIAYDTECAGGQAFVKTFTGQIIIKNRASKFLAGGDSGSLMVEDVDTNPRAVGLLFAGSSQTAIANPIDEVLSFLGASMVGN